MTTYPLSEPAMIYATDPSDDATPEAVGQGTLEECVDIVAGFSADWQKSVIIQMDNIDLKFGAREIRELLRFLRAETAGLSNTEIAAVKSADL